MTGQPETRRQRSFMILTTTLFLISSATVAAVVMANGGDAEIDVFFHADGMGFDVTSSKGLSNIIIEYCDGSTEKIEGFTDETLNFTHEGDQIIVGIWVKSGANTDPDGPPGAGERFDSGAECEPGPTETTTPPTPTNTTTPPPPNDTTTPPSPTPTTTAPPDRGPGDNDTGNDTAGGQGDIPCSPDGLTVRASGEANILTWEPAVGADAHRVYRAHADGEFELLREVAGDAGAYSDSDVEAQETYRYRVTAVEGDVETSACPAVEVTAIPVLPTLFAGVMASVLGIGAYLFSRRRGAA